MGSSGSIGGATTTDGGGTLGALLLPLPTSGGRWAGTPTAEPLAMVCPPPIVSSRVASLLGVVGMVVVISTPGGIELGGGERRSGLNAPMRGDWRPRA